MNLLKTFNWIQLNGKTGLRLLSENECKAIMGFPKKFIFPVSRTQMYRQLGNAVVVPVVKEIAKEVIKILAEKKSYDKKLKKSAWLYKRPF